MILLYVCQRVKFLLFLWHEGWWLILWGVILFLATIGVHLFFFLGLLKSLPILSLRTRAVRRGS